MARLTGINVFPIKSCQGISPDHAEVEARGFPLDRRWMLIDETGKFLTQRHEPGLREIHVEDCPDSLLINCRDLPPLAVPKELPSGTLMSSRVWDDHVEGLHVSEEADEWFSQALGQPVKLTHMDQTIVRKLEKDRLPQDRSFEVSFADGYPYLLTNQSSLDDLNSRLTHPVGMDRFRSNIIVEGFEPFAEDDWKHIQIGEAEFLVVKPCARCVVTTIDQGTGVRSKEPLRTLSKFRNIGGKAMFGMNMVVHKKGPITLGDEVIILE